MMLRSVLSFLMLSFFVAMDSNARSTPEYTLASTINSALYEALSVPEIKSFSEPDESIFTKKFEALTCSKHEFADARRNYVQCNAVGEEGDDDWIDTHWVRLKDSNNSIFNALQVPVNDWRNKLLGYPYHEINDGSLQCSGQLPPKDSYDYQTCRFTRTRSRSFLTSNAKIVYKPSRVHFFDKETQAKLSTVSIGRLASPPLELANGTVLIGGAEFWDDNVCGDQHTCFAILELNADGSNLRVHPYPRMDVAQGPHYEYYVAKIEYTGNNKLRVLRRQVRASGCDVVTIDMTDWTAKLIIDVFNCRL